MAWESGPVNPKSWVGSSAECMAIAFLPQCLLLEVWALIKFYGSQWGVILDASCFEFHRPPEDMNLETLRH